MKKLLLSGLWKIVLFILYSLILAPVVVVLGVSFTATEWPEFPPEELSLRWYRSLGKLLPMAPQMRYVWDATRTSVTIALMVVILTIAVGILVAYVMVRYRFPGKGLVDAVVNFPVVMPSLVSGIALLLIFSRLRLFSVLVRLMIGHVIVVLPWAVRTMITSLAGFKISLEEAAMTLGASRIAAFRHITLPMLTPGIIGASIFAFIGSFMNFTVSFFLYTGDVKPFPMWMYEYMRWTFDPGLAAVSALFIVPTLIAVIAMQRFVGLAAMFGYGE